MTSRAGSASAQASTSSNSAGELLAIRVSTFCRQLRLTWQGWQAQPPAWGGRSQKRNPSSVASARWGGRWGFLQGDTRAHVLIEEPPIAGAGL